MKAFITSVGEKTTKICRQQLEKYGFKVVLLDEKESWFEKYKKFISLADEDCLRVDADIVPNKNIKDIEKVIPDKGLWMAQYCVYCFYKNDIRIGAPMLYRKKGIRLIRNYIDGLDKKRPETAAWRLGEMLPHTYSSMLVVGMHGFFQDDSAIERERARKEKEYDFGLVDKLNNL